MKKVISYSLYGDNKRYSEPLLQNALNIKNFYEDWTIYVYHDNTVPKIVIDDLSKLGALTFDTSSVQTPQLPPKLWRFLPTLSDDIDLIIFRDADSLFTLREVDLVNHWVVSEKPVHIIRDHPLHIAPIMAGMFGIKKSIFDKLSNILFKNELINLSRKHDYDQVFLADFFYPNIYSSAMIHSSFFKFKNECIHIIDKSTDDNYIGSVAISSKTEEKHNIKLLKKSKFINGIPYSLARLFRYRVRPVLYSSILFNYFQ